MLYTELSGRIISACYKVHSVLGPGLLERPYHNALFYELKKRGLSVIYNKPFNIHYENEVVGEYFADLVIDNKIIVEIKSVSSFCKEHAAQVLNYLHISKYKLGLLVNFRNSSIEVKRFVL